MNIKHIISLFWIFIPISCSNQLQEELEIANKNNIIASTRSGGQINYDDITMLHLLGIDTSGLMSFDDFYIAENRLYISKSDLLQFAQVSSNIQKTSLTQTKRLPIHYQNIKFVLSTPKSFSDAQTNCIIAGLNDWDNIPNCGIDICSEMDNTSEEHLYVMYLEFRHMETEVPLIVLHPNINNPNIYKGAYINTANSLWSYVDGKKGNEIKGEELIQLKHLIAHTVGELLGFDSIEEYDTATRSIMMNETLLSEYPDLWIGLVNEYSAISQAYPEYSESTYTYTWQPNIAKQEDKHLLWKGNTYTFSINNKNQCCKATDISYQLIVKNDAGTIIEQQNSTRNSFTISFDSVGHYELFTSINDKEIKGLHRQKVDLYVIENDFSVVPPINIALGNEITLRYNYWHPDHHNITYEFSVEEVLFTEDTESSLFTNSQIFGNKFIFTPQKYGCYYIDGIVKNSGEEVSRKCYNLTILNDLATNIDIVYDNTNSDISPYSMTDTYTKYYYYDIHQDRTNGNNARTAYFFEYETETQKWNEAPSRAVCRTWFLDYDLIVFKENESEKESVLKMVQNGDMISYRDAYYQYYTGNLYCPENGLRIVENKDALNLPMHCVYTPIVNAEYRPIISDIELNIVRKN